MSALVKTITTRLEVLLESEKRPLVLAGGVAASKNLRMGLEEVCKKYGVELYLPPLKYCGDNAAMIGAQAFFEYQNGNVADLNLNAYATAAADKLPNG